MSYLARDVSSFPLMIQGDYIYVDKTQDIYNLYATKDRYHFLSRPRRFGKSLLISTLYELFSGNKKLFNDLWISRSDFAFEEHPILHFDFSAIAHRSPEDMLSSLHERIDDIGEAYGVSVSHKKTFESKLTYLIPKLGERNSVVLLIDEYDHPLLKHIKNIPLAKENQKILKSFYEALKSMDVHYRAIFIIGVTKFAKTSLFSGFNNLRDISESPQFASILGYTEDEILHYFKDAVESFAKNSSCFIKDLRAKMKRWYNGYRFSTNDVRVYNPYSIVYYLKDQKCANYWFGSGTPSFLVEVLRENPLILSSLEDSALLTSSFDTFEVGEIPTLTLLYQSGYLTIKTYRRVLDNDTFTLGFPNEEIKRSIGILMVGLCTDKSKADVGIGLNKLHNAL